MIKIKENSILEQEKFKIGQRNQLIGHNLLLKGKSHFLAKMKSPQLKRAIKMNTQSMHIKSKIFKKVKPEKIERKKKLIKSKIDEKPTER